MRRGAAAFLIFALAIPPAMADVNPAASAGTGPPIALPSDGDDFSRLAAQAANHDPATDFRALRFAWLTSAARKRRSELALAGLTGEMVEAARSHNDSLARDKATELVSAQYTSLLGQRFLRGSCTALHDDACAAQAHFVEFGMLESILKSGDGKTCETGWEVALIGEEYFILGTLGLKVKQQALLRGNNGGHSCDAMTATDASGKDVVYYFTIDRVLADEMDRLKLK